MNEKDFWTEFNQIKQDLMDKAEKAGENFWPREDLSKDDVFKAIKPRDWHEIAYVVYLSTQLIKYWEVMDRKFITAISNQATEEAQHYDLISNILEKNGYEAPTAPANEYQREWEALHWEALETDSTCAIAIWNVSETSTTSQMSMMIEHSRRIGLEDVAKVYERIERDEKGHTNLGVRILKRHMTTESQRINAIKGARRIGEIMGNFYESLYKVEN